MKTLSILMLLISSAIPAMAVESTDNTQIKPNAGQQITDALGHVWTFRTGVAGDSRGNVILVDNAATGAAAVLLAYESHKVYALTASNNWWGPLDLTGNGPHTTDPRPVSPPPPPTITGISMACVPAAIQTGQTSSCTATITGTGAFDNSVTWSASLGTISAAGIYTPTGGIGPVTITVTANGDTTKVATQTIQVQEAPPAPPPCTGTVVIPYSVTISGFTVTGTQTCTWTLDPNTGILTLSGCH